MSCNILCCKKDRKRGPCNEVRILEFFLCICCLTCAITAGLYGHLDRRIQWFFVPLYSIPAMYAVITFIDIIVTWSFFPIGWRAWILFSVGGSLLFFLCVGLSPLLLTWLFFLYTILYVITALVFLMDGLCIVSMIRTLKLGQEGDRTCCNIGCGHNKPTQVAPYADNAHTCAQTLSNSTGDANYPKQGQQKPYPNTQYPEKQVDYNVDDDIYPKENMMGEPGPPLNLGKMSKYPYKKYQDIDMTPLKNPFLAQAQ